MKKKIRIFFVYPPTHFGSTVLNISCFLLIHTANPFPLTIAAWLWEHYLSLNPWSWEKDINNETPCVATRVSLRVDSCNDSVSPETGDARGTHDSTAPGKNYLLSCNIRTLEKKRISLLNHKPQRYELMITWSDLLWHMQRATLRTNKQTHTQQQQIWKAKVKNREHGALTSVFELQDLAMLRTVSSFNSYLLLHNRLPQSVATKTICYFPQFLRVRNLLESSSGYLMWLSSVMGQPAGLSRTKGSTPKMAIGRRPWFIAKCVFPQGCLSILMTWCPQSEWSQSEWPENENI